jgi:hypothetical protein
MNWKGRGGKRLFLKLRYYTDICLEELRNTMKVSVRTAGVTAEIRTDSLSNKRWHSVSLTAGNWKVTSRIIADLYHRFGEKVSEPIFKKPEGGSSRFI